MNIFKEFVDRKQRDSKRHLGLLEKIFKKSDLKVESFLDEEDPYIFVHAPQEMSFDGIRIYEIGDMMAYRIQKESKTHPYGRAYSLNVEDMFNDYMSEDIKEEEAGKKVIKGVIEEVKKFFKNSLEAENDLENSDFNSMDGGIMLRTGGTDYSNLVHNRM